jgi:hypothetical protein
MMGPSLAIALHAGAGRGPAHLKPISPGPALTTPTTLDPAFLAPNTALWKGNLTATRLSSAVTTVAGGTGAPGNVTTGATLLFLYLPAVQHLHSLSPANGWDVGGTGTILPDSEASLYASIGPTCYPAATPTDVSAQFASNFGASPWVNTAAVATCVAAGYHALS